MVIQPLLFPPKGLINEPELFFQGSPGIDFSEPNIHISAGSELSLGTYFNAFSVGKWREYTILDNLSLILRLDGAVEIKALHAIGSVDGNFFDREHTKYPEGELIRLINEKSYTAPQEEVDCSLKREGNKYTVSFKELYENGVLYIKIKALTDAVFYGGQYTTDIDEAKIRPVKLAIGICTYKREKAVYDNVTRIISEIIENQESPLSGKLEVYIADNGQTLDVNKLNNEKVHVFKNPNLGGVGGFTRTIIEALFHDKAKEFTHIILMDDDILLYPAVLERTFYFLQLLNERYRKAILGAGMLLMEKPYMNHASGVLYRDDVTYIGRANHKFFDLRKPQAVASNEVINETNHTGWWYACIPQKVADKNNLPMPFFVHYDDVEYGIRNIENGEIYINGICVWHPSPLGKSPVWMTYYDTRNRLITMFSKRLQLSCFFKYILAISKQFLFHATRYEYDKTGLMLSAFNDFIEGAQAFMAKDALMLHQELLSHKNNYLSPDDVGISREAIINVHHKNRTASGIKQLFCSFLPSKDTIVAVDARYPNLPYRAKKLYMYDKSQDKGYILERNQKTFFKQLFEYQKTILKLFCRYRRLLNDWNNAKPTLTSLLFWENYLGLEHKE